MITVRYFNDKTPQKLSIEFEFYDGDLIIEYVTIHVTSQQVLDPDFDINFPKKELKSKHSFGRLFQRYRIASINHLIGSIADYKRYLKNEN